MTTTPNPATPLPWHANAIDSKRGRITGDETSQGWDKPDIHGATANVARVYRPADVRFIAHAANAYPTLVARIRNNLLVHDEMDEDGNGPITCTCQQCGANRALLRSLGEDA